MNKKQQRKLRKRAHIAAAVATQKQWIDDAFAVKFWPNDRTGHEDRHWRDRMFARARYQLTRAQRIPAGVEVNYGLA